MFSAFQRFLRAPRTILAELTGLVIAGVVGAVVPQSGSASTTELEALQRGSPWLSAPIRFLNLDQVFHSPWFLALTLLTAASLAVMVLNQVRRLLRSWSAPLQPAHFLSAPLKAEFERCARTAKAETRIWTEKRWGLAGSTLFHTGLLLVIIAGALRALFGTEAAVDILEGETLAPESQAWAAHWPGRLAGHFQLPQPVNLQSVESDTYPNGEQRKLQAQLSVGGDGHTLAVNHDLTIGGRRLHLGTDHGMAALLEWERPGTAISREAVLLTRQNQGRFEGASGTESDLRAHVRGWIDSSGRPAHILEVRVMKGAALLGSAAMRLGETMPLPDGTRLRLAGAPLWIRLRGSYDPALWLAYAGFAWVLAGAVLLFVVIKVDGCLVITPLGERERVFVALKPHRFAPLFEERFQDLVDQLGGRLPLNQAATPAARPAEAPPPLQNMTFTLAHTRNGILLLTALLLTSCGRPSADQARALVEHYNRVVTEAYRRGDVRLIDPVVGPNEGRKLAGLIGVRNDLGITLDAELLSLKMTSVHSAEATLDVRTQERWRYRDLKIGTGEQLGEASLDTYEMLYRFKKIQGAWLVDEIQFTTPPQVGRQQTPWLAQQPASHGSLPSPSNAGGTPP